MEPFINARQDVTDASSLEWKHYTHLSKDDLTSRWRTPMGKGLLNNLRSTGFSREALEQHIGKLYGKFDLRGIPLQKTELNNLDL